MIIRQAHQQGISVLAELIYASGPQAFDALFTFNNNDNPQDFLLSALQHKDGQYGFANHWLALKNDKILASVSAWHTELNSDFHQATMRSVVEHFGLEQSIDVVARSQVVKHFIPAPQAHEWCIGHLAVLPQYQRQGIASQLLQFMGALALQKGKSTLSLDVSQDNLSAIQFYQQLGFNIETTSALSPEMQRLGLTRHLHLSKLITCQTSLI
ncbi:GNAT family N-acetyltransferase [Paraglaciecola sp.]|uniref:GNAT family N-acetyltransferase n=1 Tax=Paraglaciecola sp. TaxID=1920173 RepID=UPI0030F4AD1B